VNASNKVRIGNTYATIVIEGQTAWTYPSDGRFKNNVTENVKGLEFIKKLRPVNYNFDTKKFDLFLMQNMPDSIKAARTQGIDYTTSENIIHTGFIAQEVEQAAKDCGYTFDGVHAPADGNDNYGVAYSQFVVPLVKAVQELSQTQDSLIAVIATMKGSQRTNESGNGSGKAESTLQVELVNNNQTILYQNEPNPFDGATVIRYFIPENSSGSAYVGFYDMYGKEINKLEITEKGFGKIEANTENLSSGIYSYSIIVNDKVIDTKKMLKSK